MSPRNRKEAKLVILRHLLEHVDEVVTAKTLADLAGRYSHRRIVEDLQRRDGWQIATGATVRDMIAVGDWIPDESENPGISTIQPDDVILGDAKPDPDAPSRWELAARIRRKSS